jgi:hypothetical protein
MRDGPKKNKTLPVLLVGGLALAGILSLAMIGLTFFDPYHREDICFQCGARRIKTTLRTRIEDNRDSRRIEKILGHPCEHRYWSFDWSTERGVHYDGFAHRSIPILYYSGGLLDSVELFPLPEWQRRVIQSLGDPSNRLKWLAAAIIMHRGIELGWVPHNVKSIRPVGESDWQRWRDVNEKYFEVVTDPDEATVRIDEYASSIEGDPDAASFFQSAYNSHIRDDLKP